jgi:hypothetical protein
MATRSRAAAAAARATGRIVATGGQAGSGAPLPVITRQRAELVGRVVGELEHLPAFETEAIAERVAIFQRFVDRARMGPSADDARALVAAVVRRGHAWLTRHPDFARLPGKPWGLVEVELLARYFAGDTDPAVAEEAYLGLVRRLCGGGVAPGDATLAARALVEWGEGRFGRKARR